MRAKLAALAVVAGILAAWYLLAFAFAVLCATVAR